MKKILTLVLAASACIGAADTSPAAIVISTDLGAAPGVTPTFAPGDTVVANIRMELTGSTDLALYNFSVQYDANELTLLSREEHDFGSLSELDTTNPNDTAGGYIYRIDAGTFAPTGETAPIGPLSVATLTFQVNPILTDDLALDITPGLFAPADDFFFDSAGNDVTSDAVFSGASVMTTAVPEPGSALALTVVFLGGLVARRRGARRASKRLGSRAVS